MSRHNQIINFATQLATNAASRIAYLALLASLTSTNANNTGEQVQYLTLSIAISSIISIQIFSYSQAVAEKKASDTLIACRYQLALTLMGASLALSATTLLAKQQSIFQTDFATALITTATMFAANEISFAVNTIQNNPNRATYYYGINFGFYTLYLLLSNTTSLTAFEVGSVVGLLGLIALSAQVSLSTRHLNGTLNPLIKTLAPRAHILIANLPTILTQTIIVFILNKQAKTYNTTIGAEFLALISISGIIAFGFGNYFQYFGRSKLESHIELQKRRNRLLKTTEALTTIAACTALAIPAYVMYAILKNAPNYSPEPLQALAVGCYAAMVAKSQWFSASCIRLHRVSHVVRSNVFFLLVASATAWCIPNEPHQILLFGAMAKLLYQEWAINRILKQGNTQVTQ